MNKSGHINKFTSIIFCALSCIFILSQSIIAAEIKTNIAEPLKVEIVSPKEGEKVHGNITIEARVNHPEAVEYCEFYIQEPGAKDRYGWEDYSPPYFWGGDGQILDTALFDDGSASAVVFCLSKDNKSVKFEKRVQFIIDNGKPTVEILSPKDSSIVKGNVVIYFSADDTKGIHKKAGITAAYLYIDGGFSQVLEKPPFETMWDTYLLQPGLHSITAIVEDNEGFLNSHSVIVRIKE